MMQRSHLKNQEVCRRMIVVRGHFQIVVSIMSVNLPSLLTEIEKGDYFKLFYIDATSNILLIRFLAINVVRKMLSLHISVDAHVKTTLDKPHGITKSV